MTARRILSHLALAVRDVYAASTYTDPEVRVGIARLAVVHLTDAVALISPAAGVRVAEAARRAFDDAHRRAVARDLDAHGLDEGGVAACAAEGMGGHVVDVVAGGADEEGLHGGERSTLGPHARFACHMPGVPPRVVVPDGRVVESAPKDPFPITDGPRCACGALATHIETEWSVASGEADFERVVGHRCPACIDEMVLPTRPVAPEEWDAVDRAVKRLGDEPCRWRLH